MARNKVLIVDDTPEVRKMLSSVIRRKTDFEPIEAADGEEGLSALLRLEPDEVVAVALDKDMPGWDGYRFAIELWSNYLSYREVPIIAIGTAFIDKEIELMGKCYKNFVRMCKPVRMRPFIECLKMYAERE